MVFELILLKPTHENMFRGEDRFEVASAAAPKFLTITNDERQERFRGVYI